MDAKAERVKYWIAEYCGRGPNNQQEIDKYVALWKNSGDHFKVLNSIRNSTDAHKHFLTIMSRICSSNLGQNCVNATQLGHLFKLRGSSYLEKAIAQSKEAQVFREAKITKPAHDWYNGMFRQSPSAEWIKEILSISQLYDPENPLDDTRTVLLQFLQETLREKEEMMINGLKMKLQHAADHHEALQHCKATDNEIVIKHWCMALLGCVNPVEIEHWREVWSALGHDAVLHCMQYSVEVKHVMNTLFDELSSRYSGFTPGSSIDRGFWFNYYRCFGKKLAVDGFKDVYEDTHHATLQFVDTVTTVLYEQHQTTHSQTKYVAPGIVSPVNEKEAKRQILRYTCCKKSRTICRHGQVTNLTGLMLFPADTKFPILLVEACKEDFKEFMLQPAGSTDGGDAAVAADAADAADAMVGEHEACFNWFLATHSDRECADVTGYRIDERGEIEYSIGPFNRIRNAYGAERELIKLARELEVHIAKKEWVKEASGSLESDGTVYSVTPSLPRASSFAGGCGGAGGAVGGCAAGEGAPGGVRTRASTHTSFENSSQYSNSVAGTPSAAMMKRSSTANKFKDPLNGTVFTVSRGSANTPSSHSSAHGNSRGGGNNNSNNNSSGSLSHAMTPTSASMGRTVTTTYRNGFFTLQKTQSYGGTPRNSTLSTTFSSSRGGGLGGAGGIGGSGGGIGGRKLRRTCSEEIA